MRRRFLILFLSLCVCLLSACGGKNTDRSDYRTASIASDREIYTSLDELLSASDIAVIGSFCSDAEQKLTYSRSDEYGRDILTDAVSTCRVAVSRVLYGGFDGKEIKVSQRYGISDEQKEIVTFSSMLPMERGGEWIFFLYYDSVSDTYWCAGDRCGRMPLFDGEAKDAAEKYIALQNELDSVLWQNNSIPLDELEQYYGEGRQIFYDSAHNAYALDGGSAEQASAVRNEMRDIYSGIDPKIFGVYSIDDVDLDLYTEAVRYFDL